VVDQDAHSGRLQNRGHLDQSVPVYLHVGEHLQSGEVVQQRCGVPEVIDAEQCCLHGDADHAAIAQSLQFVAAGVVFDHSGTLEPTVPPCEEIQ